MEETAAAGSGGGPGPAAPTTTGRSIVGRRSLPNARALVGALLITASAVGAFLLATAGDEGTGTPYLVLVTDIEPGDEVGLDDVAVREMTLSAELASTALRSSAGLEGATALRLLRAGSILDARDLNGAAFVDGTPVVGMHELTVPVPRDRSPLVLRRGDRVTLLAFDAGAGVLRTALEDALVLSFETESSAIGSSEHARLTVALPNADLVVEATLRSYDSLTVVLTSRAIDDVYVSRAPELAEDPT